MNDKLNDAYTPADLEAMTGTQLDRVRSQFESVGVSPFGWRKMLVAEKRRWLTRNLADFNKLQDDKHPTKTIGSPAIPILPGSGKLSIKFAKLAKDKNWKRAAKPNMAFPVQMKNGFQKKFTASTHRADDPKELTRQMRRQQKRHIDARLLSSAKKRAMKDKKRGGAAAVQTIGVEESI
jgi:hypothetical protein